MTDTPKTPATDVVSLDTPKPEESQTTAPEKPDTKSVLSTQEVRKPLELATLPYDIKTSIASWVTKPSDARNLCLVSKDMHAATVPSMYKTLSLYIGSPLDTTLSSLLNPNNIGLKHIKTLDLFLAHVTHPCNQLQQANFAVRMILEFLPEDILETFCWHPWSTFSADNLLLLFKKQKKLLWREGIALDRNIVPDLEKYPNVDEIFRSTRKLGLYPDGEETLKYSNFLIRKSVNMKHLVIHTNFGNRDERIAREINDTPTGPGLMTRTLFSHLMPFQNCTPLSLKHLVLHGVTLRYAGMTYCNVIDCTVLTSMQINQCLGADAFFAEVCKGGKLPLNLEVLHVKHEDNDENDTLTALDSFLCLVSGLKTLSISLCNSKELPAPAGIQRHHKTLEELNLHARTGSKEAADEIVYKYEQFRNITKDCTSLRQLSLGFPSTSLIRAASSAFSGFQQALDTLPDLTVLNITTWPTNAPSKRQLPRKIYEHLLQNVAQECFAQHTDLIATKATESSASAGTASPGIPLAGTVEEVDGADNADPAATDNSSQQATSVAPASSRQDPQRASKLAAIAFGPSCDGDALRTPILFTKGRVQHPTTGEGMLATQTDWRCRRQLTPWSEALDFALVTCSGPPTTEPANEES